MKPTLAIAVSISLMAPATANEELQYAVIKPLAVLPPPEFDHAYKGKLVITRAKDVTEVQKLCARVFPIPSIACAYFVTGGCWIIIAPDSVITAAGWTPDIVRRHEIAHCNGWPAGHPGARRAD